MFNQSEITNSPHSRTARQLMVFTGVAAAVTVGLIAWGLVVQGEPKKSAKFPYTTSTTSRASQTTNQSSTTVSPSSSSSPKGSKRKAKTKGAKSNGSSPGAIWVPSPGTSWQWQLTGTVDTSVNASVFDIDLYDNSASVVNTLHARGKKVICYVSVGSYEDWRPDASKFPSSVLGSSNGWPGERWLDIRRLSTLSSIMGARFDLCKSKGFDAVEPDNIDGYTNSTGFPLTATDQLNYNRMIANLAHARGLSVGLKNDIDQVPQLVGDFDFAVNEQCFEFDECDTLMPFIRAGKAVFHVEYDSGALNCNTANHLGFSSMLKRLSLDAWRKSCR